MEDNQCPQEPGADKEGKYRVFISYAHEDRELAEKLAAMLEKEKGVNPVWDCHITPGMPFTDAIKGMIAPAG